MIPDSGSISKLKKNKGSFPDERLLNDIQCFVLSFESDTYCLCWKASPGSTEFFRLKEKQTFNILKPLENYGVGCTNVISVAQGTGILSPKSRSKSFLSTNSTSSNMQTSCFHSGHQIDAGRYCHYCNHHSWEILWKSWSHVYISTDRHANLRALKKDINEGRLIERDPPERRGLRC